MTLLVLSLASCGGDADSGMTRYRLTEDSTILFLASSTDAPVQERLSGRFVVVRAPDPGPNTRFEFTITSLQFRGEQLFAVRGDPGLPECANAPGIGSIGSRTLSIPPLVQMDACVAIDSQLIFLQGGGPLAVLGDPPPLLTMEVCGTSVNRPVTCDDISNRVAGGYQLRIFAVPEHRLPPTGTVE
ncbi:MAG: hypothetical protein HYR72_04575 [Deltaproteobacteria bacterium]|nr:hypothetical protein [Deltaproteobacteria bacterium]